jgi:hypothetical protein
MRKTKFRIVPIINGYQILYEVQYKTFLFWKTMGEHVATSFSSYYREEQFNSIDDARDAIEKRYGSNAILNNLVSYKP